ncbi:peptidylprolyl isomerase [Paenibacillus solisilvae]|uniref:Peptidyl-prolyl cis-trans isomerase n=1 Tax=Paenibacillus solisilvae TaxID=2486751 RepID=A0ABW0VRK2_9BACL
MKQMIVLAAVLLLVLTGCGNKPNNETPAAGTDNTASNSGTTAGGNNAADAKSWSEPPKMTIDKNKTYLAHFKTDKGEFTAELFAKDAPITVNNFVFLANQKFFDGIKFHRVISDFMIQTGDPLGNGTGGPGYNIPDELDNGHKYEVGTLAMANTGQPSSGGSQFFICTGPTAANLDQQPSYSIFGKIAEGMDVVTAIANTPVEESNGELSKPIDDVLISSVTIEEK